MSKTKVYTADFETRNSTIDIANNETSVWLYDICDIETLEHRTGKTIEEFIEDTRKLSKGVIYFHNLSTFDGNFIIYYLLSNNFKFNKDKKVKTNTFQTIIDDMGKMYSIKVCFDDGKKTRLNQSIIEFRDSLNKIGGSVEEIAKAYNLPIRKGHIDHENTYRPIGYEPTAEEIAYIHNDTEIIARVLQMQYKKDMTHLTSASDTFSLYKKDCGGLFNSIYPTLPIEIDDYIRRSYRGGICQVNSKYVGKEIIGNVNVYDVNSMYPYQMCTKLLPYTVPQYFEGEYKEDINYPLYIQRIKVECELKPNKQPTILIENGIFGKTDFLIKTNYDFIELVLTNIDLELLKTHYNISEIEYIDGYKFKGSTNLFKSFIEPIYEMKSKTKGAERQLYKILLNSLYGKFAMNPHRKNIVPYLDPILDRVVYKRDDEKEEKPIYTAVASFITSYARKQLFDVIDKFGNKFLYADTDSCHLLDDTLPPELVDSKEIGKWKLEHVLNPTKYIGQKAYMGTDEDGNIIVKCAGLPKEAKELVTYDNFNIGSEFEGKKQHVKVRGGVILVNTKYTIKDRKNV